MVDADGRPRPHYRALYERLAALTDDGLDERIRTANAFFLTQGIGFTVYGDEAGIERIFPFDLIPRIVPADEWAHDRARARAARPRAQPLPRRRLPRPAHPRPRASSRPSSSSRSRNFRREMLGLEPPGGIYIHIAGST